MPAFSGCEEKGSQARAQGTGPEKLGGFRVEGSGFGVWGLGLFLRVSSLVFRAYRIWGLGFASIS